MNRRNFLKVSSGLGLTACVVGTLSAEPLTVKLPTIEKLPSIDRSLLLRCIAMVETGEDDRVIGKHGERSQYQIRRDVWVQHWPNEGFYKCYGTLAAVTAFKHLKWLDANLPFTSPVERTMRHFPLAWAWNGGLDSWTSANGGVLRIRHANYATRVSNLYDDLRPRTQRLS